MRITPQTLDIQGFRSFRKMQTFRFSEQAGLGFLAGINEVDPAMGSNASGKSSILSTLFWCLFGKSERGLQSPSLHNWEGEDPLYVKFTFLLDGQPNNFIERTWKPVTRIVLCINGAERQVSQEELEAWLGMGPEVFQQAVMASQFGRSFLEFSPAEKQKFLMALMRTERWDAYRDAAESAYARLTPEILKGEAAIAGHESRLKGMQTEYDQYMEKARTWAQDHQRRMDAATASLTNFLAELEGMRAAKAEVIAAFKSDDVTLLQGELKNLDSKSLELSQMQSEFNMDIAECQGKVKSTSAQLKKLDQLAVAGYLCPTCGQKADPQHIQAERAPLDSEMETLNKEITRLTGQKTKLANESSQVNAQCISLRNRIADVDKRKSKHEIQVRSFDNDLSRLDIQVKTQQAQIVAMEQETNQYEVIVRQRLEDIRSANEELNGFRTKLQAMKARQGINEFWKKAFKEIQLFLLNEVTLQLEMAYNTSLSALGMPTWKLAVAVENETKSGTVQNKFTVQVLSPFNPTPVPIESWCGGETQRLRLACSFGTFDLVRQLTQVTWDLEVWDEPGQYLSDEGMADLFSILRERAKVLGKQIIVTDHRTLQHESFDFKRTVTKTASGSIIQNS